MSNPDINSYPDGVSVQAYVDGAGHTRFRAINGLGNIIVPVIVDGIIGPGAVWDVIAANVALQLVDGVEGMVVVVVSGNSGATLTAGASDTIMLDDGDLTVAGGTVDLANGAYIGQVITYQFSALLGGIWAIVNRSTVLRAPSIGTLTRAPALNGAPTTADLWFHYPVQGACDTTLPASSSLIDNGRLSFEKQYTGNGMNIVAPGSSVIVLDDGTTGSTQNCDAWAENSTVEYQYDGSSDRWRIVSLCKF